MKCSKFVAKIADFEEAYRDTLTKKTRFAAEFWTFRQASYVLGLEALPLNTKGWIQWSHGKQEKAPLKRGAVLHRKDAR